MKKGDHLFPRGRLRLHFPCVPRPAPADAQDRWVCRSVPFPAFATAVEAVDQCARHQCRGVTPTHFAVIFDYSSKTFRKDLYEGYKANRSCAAGRAGAAIRADPSGHPRLQHALHRDGGFEADDIIATYAVRRKPLVRCHHHFLRQGSDAAGNAKCPHVRQHEGQADRHSRVIEKWGVPPEKMIDLQALWLAIPTIMCRVFQASGQRRRLSCWKSSAISLRFLPRFRDQQAKRRGKTSWPMQTLRGFRRQLVALRTDVPLELGLDAADAGTAGGPKLSAS